MINVYDDVSFDYSRLRGEIKRQYGTELSFAKAVGISHPSFSRKLNGERSFKAKEMLACLDALHIDRKYISIYFFTQKV